MTGKLRIEPEISSVNLVLVGNFNPAIFTPAWFVLHELLPAKAAENASLQIAQGSLTAFSTDWLQLQVTADRFSAGTSQAPYIRLCDLVVAVFKVHLTHSPVNALGINRGVHFQVSDLTARDRIGRALAPVEPWGAWSSALGLTGDQGGMTSLTMSQLDPEGRPPGGRINVTVEPSSQVGQGRLGVYVGINDHYAVNSAGPGAGQQLIGLLENNFTRSLSRSAEIIDHIMSLSEDKLE